MLTEEIDVKKDLPPATALLCPQLNSTSSCVQLEGIELKTGHCMYCKPFAHTLLNCNAPNSGAVQPVASGHNRLAGDGWSG